MNRFERTFGLASEAKLRYLDGEFQVLVSGSFVLCAVTGKQIALEDLRYWSVEYQEAYRDAAVSLQRYLERKGRPDKP
jgi:hypothetical protein